MDGLTSRFLAAFNEIERLFKSKQSVNRHKTFNELVWIEFNRGSIDRDKREYLSDVASLRNLLVHGYGNDKISAIPTEETVQEIELLLEKLTNPIKLIPKFLDSVACCSLNESVGVATRLMRENKFSQIPVIDKKGGIIDLLTTHTIALWLAEIFIEHDDLAENVPVGKVLKFKEDNHVHFFMSQDSTIGEALSKIEKAIAHGNVFQAVLITQNGKKSEKPLGIITASDIPMLRSES